LSLLMTPAREGGVDEGDGIRVAATAAAWRAVRGGGERSPRERWCVMGVGVAGGGDDGFTATGEAGGRG